jgi:hypothetical protein
MKSNTQPNQSSRLLSRPDEQRSKTANTRPGSSVIFDGPQPETNQDGDGEAGKGLTLFTQKEPG